MHTPFRLFVRIAIVAQHHFFAMETENDLPKAYDASLYEDAISRRWEESGFYNPDNLPGERTEPYSILMPPPNVTGVLHLGHALENALMDTMARYQRMRGKRVLLVPGTDHAAIATQAKVEKRLQAEGMINPRKELGREKLVEKIRAFADESQATILGQVRKMGTSCDWSRLAYTFDAARNIAVNELFFRMHRDGLIYRGYRVVNWSVKGQSTCSDDEIQHMERPSKLYTFKYSKDFPITIATTRPETKLGDTAVAVHPSDTRYTQYIGKTFTADVGAVEPLKIKIIADEGVDPSFGTGALGVTPAHSPIDFAMYEKQKAKGDPIEIIPVIDADGKMTAETGAYAGLTVEVAREKFVGWLKEHDLLEKEEDIVQNVGTSERYGDVIESLPMTQWWLDMNKTIPSRGKSLRDLMREAVTTGLAGDETKKVTITPNRFTKLYLDRVENLRDWCLSRQLWWGHRIPVWYRDEEMCVSAMAPSGDGWEQDPDTLDTWFSSGSWPFSTLGWPRTKVIFVRHGEAMSNAKGFNDGIIGNGENVLTERGEGQVKERAKALKDSGAVAIIASPITRAKQTATMMGEALQIPVTFDDRLREIGFGSYDGKDPVAFDKARGFFDGWKKQPFADAESYPSVHERSHHALKEILATYAGKTVVVVTHGDTLAVMREFGVAGDKSYGYPDPAGAVEISFSADGKQTDDLAVFHPTSWMQMGYEILYLWLMRMILMSAYTLDDVPFKDAYIHGMVRNKEGQKFSKSMGNGMDPLDVVKQYGCDALRISLLLGITPGNDSRYSEEKIESGRNFVNKLWNIGRYVLTTTQKPRAVHDPQRPTDFPFQYGTLHQPPIISTKADAWIIGRLALTHETVTKHLEQYNFSAAGEALREFTWNDFADWYLEISKVQRTGDAEAQAGTDFLLRWVLGVLLRLWHPFMPFVTEVLWKELTEKDDADNLLLVTAWPELQAHLKDSADILQPYQDLVTAIRALRAEHHLQPKQVLEVFVDHVDDQMKKEIAWMQRLTNTTITLGAPEKADGLARAVVGETTLYMDTAAGVDVAAECARLTKEAENLERYLVTVDAKLANEEFASKAPPAVLEKEKGKRAAAAGELAKIQEQLKLLQ